MNDLQLRNAATAGAEIWQSINHISICQTVIIWILIFNFVVFETIADVDRILKYDHYGARFIANN